MPQTYETVSDARDHLSAALTYADSGVLVIFKRAHHQHAMIAAAPLRHFLVSTLPSRAVIARDEHGWSVYLPDQPIAADGATLDDALDQMVEALRTYAAAWQHVLRQAPNHADNWGLVQLIELSTDEQLRDWLNGTGD
jgi:predicted RNase H-like HicB family nuclease